VDSRALLQELKVSFGDHLMNERER
jgi:hypothetical protein